jgi:hypothetical protein
MAQRNTTPLVWRPKGACDTLDSSDSFAGAMAQLSNLIPDPTTKNLWQCRPASISKTSFGSYTTPGFISALKVIGDLAFGMIASGRNAGKDEPFCYNLLTNAFVVVSGVTNANSPTSPLTTGAWTPPTMDLIGALLVVTHPGFSTGANFFGWFDITNPAAPVWHAGNMGGAIAFTVVPTAVKQFNGRAYFIQNVVAQPSVVFSDALNAVNATNANQILTFGDNVALTALGGLQLNNQLGGIIQSLIVFKGVTNMYQVTGDSALNNLTVNTLNITTGTLAPNTICNTPEGLAFMSPEGMRVIDFQAAISPPIGLDGTGIAVPFVYAVVPSRVVAQSGGNVMRVSVQNGLAVGSPNQEWWYDFSRGIWTGPHTFPASLIQPYKGTFIEAPIGITASLWQSDVVQSSTSTYVENGVQMSWNWLTAMLPDNDQIKQNSMQLATLDMALASTIPNINVQAIDQNGTALDTVQVQTPGGSTIWGAFTWGGAPWLGPPAALAPRPLSWTHPIVFARLQLQANGQSAAGIKIGTAHLRYQVLGYTPNLQAVA